MTRRFIGLDFDGVLCDSIDECFVVGHNAYFEMLGQKRTCASPADVAPGFLRYYRENRYLVRPAGEFFLLFHSFFQRPAEPLDSVRFAELARVHAREVSEFEKIFFAGRYRLYDHCAERWIGLHAFYPGVADFLDCVLDENEVAIITMKDETSTALLLKTISARNIRICGNEEIKRLGSKENVISFLLEERRWSSGRFHYLDDNLGHLHDVQPLAINCYYAAWGYSHAPAEVVGKPITYCKDIHQFHCAINEDHSICQ